MSLSAVSVVFCTGIVRSGSTWSFNVCRQLAALEAGRHGLTCSSGYVGEADLEAALGQGMPPVPGPTVLKAHTIGPAAVAALRTGAARAVCTFRDPRDCVASDLTFRGKPFDEAVRRVTYNLAYLGFYRSSRHTLFVRYEDMMANPLRQVGRIASHLGVEVDHGDHRRVDALTSLGSARAVCAGLTHRRPEEVVWSETRRVDPATQLHENHVQGGRVGRWRDELTADQQQQLGDVFHPWLVELGYEADRSTPYA